MRLPSLRGARYYWMANPYCGIDYILNTYEHFSKVEYTIFPALGISFTEFGKSKDAKVVMVFNKATLKRYLAS